MGDAQGERLGRLPGEQPDRGDVGHQHLTARLILDDVVAEDRPGRAPLELFERAEAHAPRKRSHSLHVRATRSLSAAAREGMGRM
jgi:hypothetical protein